MKKGAIISGKILLVATIFSFVAASCGAKQGCSAYGKYGKHHRVSHR